MQYNTIQLIADNKMQYNAMQDNTMQSNPNGFETLQKMEYDLENSGQLWNCPEIRKLSGKIWIVVTLSGNWEKILKNLDRFETIRKIRMVF